MTTPTLHSHSTQAHFRSLVWLHRIVWLLPIHGALLIWTTWLRQPDPRTDLTGWSAFVTTDRFFISHVFGSIGGQIAGVLGISALALLVLLRTTRPGVLITGWVMHVAGSGLMIAGFGIAAFGQPVVGKLHADSPALADSAYQNLYTPSSTIVLLSGLALYSLSFAWVGRGIAAYSWIPGWMGLLIAIAGPTFGIAGFFVGVLQTVGGLLVLASGAGLAVVLRQSSVA